MGLGVRLEGGSLVLEGPTGTIGGSENMLNIVELIA